jgi:hypothetical protein
MNHWHVSYLVEKYRRDEEIAYAQRHWLAKEGKPKPARSLKPYQRWFIWLGEMLITFGCRLQGRYGQLSSIRSKEFAPKSPAPPCASA